MSKKRSIVAVVLCAVILFGGLAAAVIYMGVISRNAKETQGSAYENKYVSGDSFRKAKEASNGVWLVEGSDLDFNREKKNKKDKKSKEKGFEAVIKDACSGMFDTVFLKADCFTKGKGTVHPSVVTKKLGGSSGEVEASDTQKRADYNSALSLFSKKFDVKKLDTEKLSSSLELIKTKGRRSVLNLSLFAYNSVVKLSAELGADGILFSGLDLAPAELTAQRLRTAYALVKQANPEATVYIEVPCDWQGAEHLDSASADAMYVLIGADVERTLPTVGDYSSYSYEDCLKEDCFDAWSVYWDRVAKKKSLPLYVGFRADRAGSKSYGGHRDSTLAQTVLSDSCGSLAGRVYFSYSAFKKDSQKAMSAVKSYVTEGLDLSLAFRPLGVLGSDGLVSEATAASTTFTVRCSSLFPLYVNGVSYGLQPTGERVVQAELVPGDNSFELMQNGVTYTHTVSYKISAKSPLVTFIIPNAAVNVAGGGTLDVTVGAHVLSQITATVGKETKTLTPSGENYNDYTTFTATFTMPEAKEKSQSLGKIALTARVDGLPEESYVGAEVIVSPKGKEPAESTSSTTQIDNSPVIDIEPPVTSQTEAPTTAYTPGSSFYGTGESTTAEKTRPPLDRSVIGKACMITAEYADTRPVVPVSNTYVPTYSPLPKGTVDLIMDVVDCDDGEDYYQYYVLNSGRRVMTELASVTEAKELSDNSLTVLSSGSQGGSTTVNLSTSWRVPFNAVVTPQPYYRGYEGKLYNVSTFSASQLEITFYYTKGLEGSIDLTGSDILATYGWTANEAARTLTLTLGFKQAGRFYGYSVGYNNDGSLYIRVDRKPGVLSGCVVMLDPGHGGKDAGAIGKNGTVYEASLNLLMAQKLKSYLTAQGASVYMTRTDNSYFSLEERRQQQRVVDPDVFVSIHCNSSESSKPRGTSTYYFSPWSKTLAASINNRMVALFNNVFYRGKLDGNQGDNFYPFSVCRGTNCPSVLVETAYVSNDEDCNILLDPYKQEQIAEAIGNGISDYLKSQAG